MALTLPLEPMSGNGAVNGLMTLVIHFRIALVQLKLCFDMIIVVIPLVT